MRDSIRKLKNEVKNDMLQRIEELRLLELFQDITEELLTNSKLMRDALQKIIDEDDSYDLTATVIAEKALAAVEEK